MPSKRNLKTEKERGKLEKKSMREKWKRRETKPEKGCDNQEMLVQMEKNKNRRKIIWRRKKNVKTVRQN